MNVTLALQTILCAGVTHLVIPRGTTELLGRGEGKRVLRDRVRLQPKTRAEKSPAAGVPALPFEQLSGRATPK